MLTKEFADEFCNEWIEAWNAHDVTRVLTHYSDDFEMSSPYIAQIVGEKSGTLKGKEAVGNYWRIALGKFPTLKFEHKATLIGVNSIIITYEGTKGLSAELFFFNDDLKVIKSCAHYL